MTICLCCVSGFSSSILGRNLENWLKKRTGQDVIVQSCSYRLCKDEGDLADLILLAPQMTWARQEMEQLFPDALILAIGHREYGLGEPEMIGREILKLCRQADGDD
ncbi:PTS sugar transporter subunit IIB [Faecalibaculum rodentium]|uniref:PTS sugar transporter subunit IIB n=1 Tax=Faecalibaculum rodentium TaxID=1702221 RepID=UPI0024952CC5|nr:hypothetical protein [Faecalibaculum rodentium]